MLGPARSNKATLHWCVNNIPHAMKHVGWCLAFLTISKFANPQTCNISDYDCTIFESLSILEPEAFTYEQELRNESCCVRLQHSFQTVSNTLKYPPASSLFFVNGKLANFCPAPGTCSTVQNDLPFGFYELRIVVAAGIEHDEDRIRNIFECSEHSDHNTNVECNIIALLSQKVNFFEVSQTNFIDRQITTVVLDGKSMLLAPAISPEALSFHRDLACSTDLLRPESIVQPNLYEACHEGDCLSDPIFIARPKRDGDGGVWAGSADIVVVSPLLPSEGEAQRLASSAWACRFRSRTVFGASAHQGQEGGWDKSARSLAAFVSDNMHTFQIRCPVPEDLLDTGAQLAANGVDDRHGGNGSLELEVRVLRRSPWDVDLTETGAQGYQTDEMKAGSVFAGDDEAELVSHRLFRLDPFGGSSRSGPDIQAPRTRWEVCSMVRDEASFLVEWLEHLRILGAAHVHLYLHLTTDETPELLQIYIQAGFVTVYAWDFAWASNFVRIQVHAFSDCVLRIAARSAGRIEQDSEEYVQDQNNVTRSWALFLDVDEFLVAGGSAKDTSFPSAISEVLDIYGGTSSALKLAWRHMAAYPDPLTPDTVLTNSSFDSVPGGLTLEQYLWYSEVFAPPAGRMLMDNHNGKVFVRVNHGVHVGFGGHKVTIAPNGFVECPPDRLHIAHYLGRGRTYNISDPRHEAEAVRRRKSAASGALRKLDRSNALCLLSAKLRQSLCRKTCPTMESTAKFKVHASQLSRLCGDDAPRSWLKACRTV